MKTEAEIRAMLRLYFIAGSQDCRHHHNPAAHLRYVLETALENGITCFQFRDKGRFGLSDYTQKVLLAEQCRQLCERYRVPFIVDDDVEMALKLNADGLHIGQTDTPVAEAAARCPDMILGLSCNTLEQAVAAQKLPEIAYCGVGPLFHTQSKEDLKPVIGMEHIPKLRAHGISKPIVAIGGIKAEHAAQVRQSGADGIAVISAIAQAEDIAAAVKALL